MLRINEISKLRAFSIHMAISFIIFLFLLTIIVFIWYPSFMFHSDGGWRGIIIIAGVDVVLGPLLTLIVFKPGKPGLKFDLVFIAVIQTSALLIGSWIVYNQRPALLIFADNTFMAIPQEQVALTGLSKEKFRQFRKNRYGAVIVDLPEAQPQRSKILKESYATGGLILRGDLFIPYDESSFKRILDHDIEYDLLIKGDADKQQAVEAFLEDQGLDKAQTAFFPIFVRYADRKVLAVNRLTGELVGMINMTPPERGTKVKLR